MRRSWSGVLLCFFDSRNSTSVPLTNYSIAENGRKNSLMEWVSTGVASRNITSKTIIDGTSHSRFFQKGVGDYETLGNVTFGVTTCDASMASLSSKMIDLLALSKGEKVRQKVCGLFMPSYLLCRLRSHQQVFLTFSSTPGCRGDFGTRLSEPKEREAAQNTGHWMRYGVVYQGYCF